MSDIISSAKEHDWYAHDETLAEELIDEIERMRADLSMWKARAQVLYMRSLNATTHAAGWFDADGVPRE